MKFRHEWKYLLDCSTFRLMKSRVEHLVKKDPHAGQRGVYTVRSLYFDDYYNSAYNEKYASILDRKKYRIRVYDYSDVVIHLERKLRSDQFVHKDILPLTREDAQKIFAGDFRHLLKNASPLARIFYFECVSNLLRPRVVVDYEREPYMVEAGSVRITFDQNIRAGMENLDIFNRNMAMVEALPPGMCIMEIKFSEFLPRIIRDIMPAAFTARAALSKYVFCCDRTLYKRNSGF